MSSLPDGNTEGHPTQSNVEDVTAYFDPSSTIDLVEPDMIEEPAENINKYQDDKQEPTYLGSPSGASTLPDSVYIESLSSDLNVSPTILQSVDALLLDTIQSKIAELTTLKSEKMSLEVQLENVSLINNKKVELFKSRLSKSQDENTQLKEQVAELQDSNTQLIQRTTDLEKSYQDSSSESHSTQSKVTEVMEDNRRLVEMLERKNKEVDSLKAECDDLQDSKMKLRKDLAALESNYQESDIKLTRANRTIKSLEVNLQSEQDRNSRLDDDLKKISTDFAQYRKERSSEISKLQYELETQITNFNSLQLRHDNITSRFDELSKKYDNTLIEIKSLKDQSSLDREEHLKEASVKERLVDLLKKSLDDAKSKIEHLEGRLDYSRSGVAAESASLQTTVDDYKKQLDAKDAKIKSLENAIDDISQSGDPNISIASLPPLSPSAKATAAKHSGLSLSQLYADFTLIKRQLLQERRAKERMQRQLDDFVNELEQKAPIISATKERAVLLEKELAELSVILENTTRDNDVLQKSQAELSIRLQESDVEIASLRKQRADLARQVQHLVVQITVRNDNGGPLTPAEKSAIERIASGDTVLNDSDTDRLISDRLVTFKNIIDLQQKNENLLRVVRELGAKSEQQEKLTKQRFDSLESAAINEAKEAIFTLQDELDSAKSRLSAITKERDMFRSILSGKTNGSILSGLTDSDITNDQIVSLNKKLEDSEKELATSGEELERVRTECQKTIDMLNKQINTLTSERSSLSLELAKEKSSHELAKQRYETSEENFKYAKSESAEIRKSAQILQYNLGKQEQKSQEISEQLIEAKSTIDALRSENTNLKSEKHIWASIEQRLNKENAALNEEKMKLNELLSNLQTLELQRESRATETQKRWSSRTESLEHELSTTRARFAETSEQLREAISRKDSDARSYQLSIDALRVELSTAEKDTITKANEIERLEQKVNSLTSQLATVESRVKSFQSIAESSDAASETIKLSIELEHVKSELEEANKSFVEFKAIADAADDALQTMTTISDEYKKSSEETIQKLESENRSLSERVDILNAQVEALNNDLTSQRITLQKDVDALQAEAVSLREEAHQSTKLKNEMEASLTAQLAVASEAQQNYEKELQKHAESTSAADALRIQAAELKVTIQQLTSECAQAKSELTKSQESWDSQRAQLEEELRVAEARIQDLSSQNQIFFNQIQSLTKRSTSPSIGTENATDELRELIVMLRRDKEISDAQLEGATRDLQRVRQQLEIANTELDSTRLQLVKVQSSDSDVERLRKEYESLQKDLEQLSLFRESNTTLRNELKSSVNKAKILEKELAIANDSIRPLETKIAELKADSSHKGQELKLVTEDRDRWKQRAQDIHSKLDSIDPEEHDKLKLSVTELTEKLQSSESKLERLRVEAQDKLKKSSASRKELLAVVKEREDKLHSLETIVESAKAELEEAKTKAETLRKEFVELEDKYKALATAEASSTSSADIETVKKELETARAELIEKTKEVEKAQEFEKQVSELKNVNDTLEKKVSELQEEVQNLTSQLKMRELSATPAPLSDESTTVVEELKNSLAKVNAELEAEKAKSATTDTFETGSSDVEAKLKEQAERLRAEFDVEVQQKIDDVKARIRLPSAEKLERIAEQRTKSLEEKHARELEELKADYEKKLGDTTTVSGNKPSDENISALEKEFEQKQKEFEEKKKRELDEAVSAAQEAGREAAKKEVGMRVRLLEGKIEKLTKAKAELEEKLKESQSNVTTSNPTSEAPYTETPTLPAGSVTVTPAAEANVELGAKRHAENDGGPQEKKTKSDS